MKVKISEWNFIGADEFEYDLVVKKIEMIARTCYKSEANATPESGEEFIRKIIKRGHEAMIEHHSQSIRIVCDRGCCYDKDTKVLTLRGWKYFFDLNKDDQYYSLDDNNNIQLVKANKIISIPYNGNLDIYKTTQISLGVTPNHNMWVYDYNKRNENTKIWKFIESKDLVNKQYKFNKSANPIERTGYGRIILQPVTISKGFYDKVFPELIMNANEFFELVGLWITDGSISKGKKGSGNRISISQTKTKTRKRIKELLTILKLDYKENEKEYRINSPQLYAWLDVNFIKNGDYKKSYYIKMPRWIAATCSRENIESLLNGIIQGDGSKHTKGKGYQIYTASEDFANDIVELSLLVGKCANVYTISERDRLWKDGRISHCKKQYVVSIITTTEHLFNSTKISKKQIHYNDNVYCVELPIFHRLYVMKDGKACWCGNSHEIVRHRLASFAQESTRYCNYSQDKFGNEITVIDPRPHFKTSMAGELWNLAMISAEQTYNRLIELGESPQMARSVLPNSLKTEIVVTANLREWRKIFQLRTPPTAHPQMREIMGTLLEGFKYNYPVFFEDIPSQQDVVDELNKRLEK